MSFGKLYTFKGNARSTALLAVAKANDLDIEVVHTVPKDGVSTEYLKLNKLGKIPTFHGADDFILTEAIAIAVYLTSQNEKTTLLGKTKQDYASILRWMSYGNSEVLPALGGWFRPLLGLDPYNKKNVDDSQKKANAALKVLEDHFLVNTYLVGERVSLADLFVVGTVSRGFQNVFDKKWREEYPNVTRWYDTLINQPILSSVIEKTDYIDEAIKYTPPKKEAKEQPKKAEAKPKAKEVEEEDDVPPEPKAKHPLELLPKATFVLDEWKRQYSNNETRTVALPWFWENANFEEYSLWKIEYKYNSELSHIFMSNNLIGGTFTRLEGSRKYIFGAASVYGVKGDSMIRGALFLRGQDYLPAVEVGPDYESWNFTKLDPKNPSDQEYVNDEWAQDKPAVVGGKTYEWADGKVFK